VTWTLRDLSLTFKIPVSTLKPLMQDKEACLKLLLKKVYQKNTFVLS
jgi:hypothetical protein